MSENKLTTFDKFMIGSLFTAKDVLTKILIKCEEEKRKGHDTINIRELDEIIKTTSFESLKAFLEKDIPNG